MKEIWSAEEAAAEIGISYRRLVNMIRRGQAVGKKFGPGITDPYQIHVTEVQRLKELFAPPKPATFAQAAG